MKFDIGEAFNGLKKSSPALIAICFASGFYVFAPKTVLQRIGLDGLPKIASQIIGGAFVLSVALMITILSSSFIKKMKGKRTIRKLEKQVDDLTPDEMLRLLMMFHQPGNTISMSLQDGITGTLFTKKMIYQATSINDGIGLMTFQFGL